MLKIFQQNRSALKLVIRSPLAAPDHLQPFYQLCSINWSLFSTRKNLNYLHDINARNDWQSWWRHQMEAFLRYWPFVRGINRSPVNSRQKGQWRGALMFSLICARTNTWANHRDAGDLRRHCFHYDVTVMNWSLSSTRKEFNYLHDINGAIWLEIQIIFYFF